MRLRNTRRLALSLPAALVIGVVCSSVADSTPSGTAAAAQADRGVAVGQDSSERTIFYNGKVFTSVSGALWAQGVVVSGRTIVAVGTNDEVLAYRDPHAAIYNLEGRVLVPGFQ